jgi:murein DD-endopeptidase MepM/ murein hydrolase activator NlpD
LAGERARLDGTRDGLGMTRSPSPGRRRIAARIGTAVLTLLVAVVLPVGAVPGSTAAPDRTPTGMTPPVLEHVVRAPVVLAPDSGGEGTDAPTVVTTRWSWPVGPPHDVLRPFTAPANRYGPGHRGVDIAASPGSPVRAPAAGVVSFAGVVVDRPVLSIQHDEDLVSSFEPVTATVSAGDRVSAGQVVGVVASGAHCAERCLHFGVRRHGQYISPVLFLGGIARAVLLPLPPAGPVLKSER